MKAKINGIIVEGTPTEIFDYQKLINKKDNKINSYDNLEQLVKDIELKTGKKPIVLGRRIFNSGDKVRVKYGEEKGHEGVVVRQNESLNTLYLVEIFNPNHFSAYFREEDLEIIKEC